MKFSKVLLTACALLALAACGTTRHSSGVKVSDIPELAFVQPYAYMVFYGDDGSGLRYGILIYSYGYTMSEKAYQRERLEKTASKIIDTAAEKLTGIGGLTNPSRSYIPSDPYGNEMACVVVDAQEQRVVYYCKQTPTFASHPKDNEDVSKLLHKLLKDFIR